MDLQSKLVEEKEQWDAETDQFKYDPTITDRNITPKFDKLPRNDNKDTHQD